MPEAVVLGAFFRIAQDAVGLRRLLEFLLRSGVVRIFVRMMLERHLPIGFLDLVQ